jgi:hypothetical protein
VLQNGGDSTTRERRKVIVAFCPKWRPRLSPLRPLDSMINRIAERLFSCRQWRAVQSRQPPRQEHPGGRLYRILSPIARCEGRIFYSLYVRRVISKVRISSVFPLFLAA